MKVTFVGAGCEQLSVSLLGAICRREGHEVGLAYSAALFDDRYQLDVPLLARLFDDRAAVLSEIERQQPDVLACSVVTNLYRWMLGIAREARARLPGLKVVFGGVHPSAVPDRVLARSEVDFVCAGEGDFALPRLLREMAKGGPHGPIPNMRYRSGDGVVCGPQAGFVQDLDSLPWFDKRLYEEHIRIRDFYITSASRGCPYRCSFCFNSFWADLPERREGRFVRWRSADHVLGELSRARRRYRIRFVDFEDDIFTLDRAWLRPFLERYRKEIGVPFQCLTHPRHIDDERARWLAEAGCEWCQMGIQSADDEYKRGSLRRTETTHDVERAMEALSKHGVKIKGDHIFGLPGEPEGAQERARASFASHTPARIDTFWATFYPGTQMAAEAQRSGLLTGEDVERLEEGLFQSYHAGGHVGEERRSALLAYEVLFRLMPLLPPAARLRLPPQLFDGWPHALAHGAGLAADLLNAARNRSPDHLAFALQYLHGMARTAALRLGLPPPPATRPVNEP